MPPRHVMLCTVGTSGMGNCFSGTPETKKLCAIENLPLMEQIENLPSEEQWNRLFQMLPHEGPISPESPPDHKAAWLLRTIYRGAPTAFFESSPEESPKLRHMPSAELQSTLQWLLQTPEPADWTFYLFPSKDKESLFTAQVFRLFLNLALDPHQDHFSGHRLAKPVTIHPVEIRVGTQQEFFSSVKDMFDGFDRVLQETSGENATPTPVFFNMTGSYKAVCAYSTLYAQMREIPCLYTFEGSASRTTVELMALPLSYALPAMEEEMSLLRALQESGDRLPLGLTQQGEDVPRWLKHLMVPGEDGRLILGPMTTRLLEAHEAQKRNVDLEGRALLDRIRSEDPALGDYMKERIGRDWAELWLGDQIPETVEHSRRHSKRLMETTAHLFRAAPDTLKSLGLERPAPLALLLSAIVLHDIGHAAINVDLSANGQTIPFSLGRFPSAVREVHHLLSQQRIDQQGESLFPEGHPLVPLLRRLTPKVCAYHRGYTTLRGSLGAPKGAISSVGRFLFGGAFEESLKPLEERLDDEDRRLLAEAGMDVPTLLRVTALLRVVDGCDVQADRTVDEVYLKARNRRTREEAEALEEGFSRLKDHLPEDLRGLTDTFLGCARPYAEHMTIFEASPSKGAPHSSEDMKAMENMETLSKQIYTRVFEELQRSLDTLGNQMGLENPLEMEALSLVNRVTFKYEQFLHFHKHRCVRCVLPLRGERDGAVTVHLFPMEESPGNKRLERIVDDIQKEFKAVESLFQDTGLSVSVHEVSSEVPHG